MELELPAIPAGVLMLLSLLAPYAVSLVQSPSWSSGSKKLVAIVVSAVLALVVIGFYYWATGDVLPDWPVLILLAISVTQASYALVTGKSADRLTQVAGVGRAETVIITDDPAIVDPDAYIETVDADLGQADEAIYPSNEHGLRNDSSEGGQRPAHG